MPLDDLSAFSAPSLGAKLAMCVPPGGSNIELMSPHDPAAPLSQSLTRFLDRRGDGLFALMLESPDPNAEAELLRERGPAIRRFPLPETARDRPRGPGFVIRPVLGSSNAERALVLPISVTS